MQAPPTENKNLVHAPKPQTLNPKTQTLNPKPQNPLKGPLPCLAHIRKPRAGLLGRLGGFRFLGFGL